MPSFGTFLLVVSEKKSFEEIVDDGRTDGRTDGLTDGLTPDAGRRTTDNPNSSPWHFVPGELKSDKTKLISSPVCKLSK